MADLARLQRALAIEARHDFQNLRGNATHFAEFVREAIGALARQGTPEDRDALAPVTTMFARYELMDAAGRARAVERLAALMPRWQRQPPARRPDGEPEDWRDKPVQFVKGVGPRMGTTLARLGIHTVDGLLRHYPRQHLDYQQRVRIGQLQAGNRVTVWGAIKRVEAYNSPGGKPLSILTVHVSDGTGTVAARWFGRKATKPGLDRQKARFPVGQSVLMSGEPRLDTFTGRLIFDRPQVELLGVADPDEPGGKSLAVGRIVPVYDLTEGLHANALRKAIRTALDLHLPLVRDWLPAEVRDRLASGPPDRRVVLVPLKQALEGIHFPRSAEDLQAARTRLAFDELFWMQLGLAWRRAQVEAQAEALQLPPAGELVTRLRALLPFALTHAQERVLREVQADLASASPMNRLVQGDVGSGKTVVALLSLLVAVENGYQGALMAPTEILAEQHHAKIREWVEALGLKAALLLGKQGRRERQAALRAIEAHAVDLVVGTHALIQEGVRFARLGLVVIDEQHRFGVRQRAMLREKGQNPEVLVMTATPIPRTLALTVHGDLDVSVIDELPPGRKPVETRWCRTAREGRDAWEHVREELRAGHQCYVVYPLIEDSEQLASVKSATAEHERLAGEIFPEFRVDLLHGQMTPEEKERVIAGFRHGQTDVLVSTTVIEVGVDVPNASVMVIENAERFGLAQLHQLRGRVGRGSARSYCYLISSSRSETTAQRLGIMEKTNDGFVIAEQDLALRGPGEFLGTRQSGLPDLRAADLVNDTLLLERARELARDLLVADPGLARRPWIKADLFRYFQANLAFLEVG
ncbi:MAG: ATP-dependent DNA helicase RecG [Candidatus Sericytochromatia bacterium]|nr:ATP-dependent DNA helicase RecG [Candidatus Sericytochromatia bacterium]